MPNMKEPMTQENKRRSLIEEHWDYPIRLDCEKILRRFNDNHNREDFKNNEDEYWTLVKKAIVIACRMAEFYREESKELSRYKFDDIRISGGGGGGDKYRISIIRNVAFWQPSVGNVEIDFTEKNLKVWMEEWKDEDKNINPFNGKKLYTKEIQDLDEVLEFYKGNYYYEERD